LLGVPHIVVCVNKMDLVDWSQERFEQIRDDFERFAMKLDVSDVTVVPVSARSGDNLVHRSAEMPWYAGTSLLHQLEQIHISANRNLIDARLPVQYVIRGDHSGSQGFRGYAGTIASGTFQPGDEVTVLPSGYTTAVEAVHAPGGAELAEGFAGQAATVRLRDNLDVGRGDMICRPQNRPHVGSDLDAIVCWMSETSELRPGTRYVVEHTTRQVRASVQQLDYRLDINTLHRDEQVGGLSLNDVGRVRLRSQQPLMFDPYHRNRETGSFVLIDETTNDTVAAGMITGPSVASSELHWRDAGVTREQRVGNGMTVWLTGLSASGKS